MAVRQECLGDSCVPVGRLRRVRVKSLRVDLKRRLQNRKVNSRRQIMTQEYIVDAAYQRALQAGGSSIAEPEDKPYSERSAGVKDSFGNIWWISTFKNSVDL